MKNDIIISKMIVYIEKIQRYTQGMTYEVFKESDMALEGTLEIVDRKDAGDNKEAIPQKDEVMDLREKVLDSMDSPS